MEAIPLCLSFNKPHLCSLTQRRFSIHVKVQTELEYNVCVCVCVCVCVFCICARKEIGRQTERQTGTNFKSYLFYVISGSHDYEDCCIVGCDAVYFGS